MAARIDAFETRQPLVGRSREATASSLGEGQIVQISEV